MIEFRVQTSVAHMRTKFFVSLDSLEGVLEVPENYVAKMLHHEMKK